MSIFLTFLEYIFPRRESHRIVDELCDADAIAYYKPTNHGDFTALSSYAEPSVKALIKEAKFHQNEKAWRLLAILLAKHFRTSEEGYLVVPIPLSKERQKKRGYNQVTKVLDFALKECPELHFRNDILYRKRDTLPQTSMRNKEERIKNIEDAFGVRLPVRCTQSGDGRAGEITGADIIIVDDVATTGATLKAARLALMSLRPKSVKCLAVAH